MGNRSESARKAWLLAGLKRFSEGGEYHLRVERIAEDLGITKGSYYYYFRDRDDFIEQMLDLAFDRTTQAFIDRASEAITPRDRLQRLTVSVMCDQKGRDFDFYVRQLARTNRTAARYVKNMDESRLAFIQKLIEECGTDSSVSARKAQMFYNYYLGFYIRNQGQRVNRKTLNEHLSAFSDIVEMELTVAEKGSKLEKR